MQKRLMISFIIIMCLTLTLSYMLFLNIYSSHIVKIIKNELYKDADNLFLFLSEHDDVEGYLNSYVNETGNNISVVYDGKQINSSQGVSKEIINNLTNKLKESDKSDLIRISGNERIIAVGESSPDRAISVFISASYDKYAGFGVDEWTYLIVIFTLCLAVSILLWYRFIFHITRSIKNITRAVSDITDGNYEELIHYEYDDEMGELVKAFNLMANKLKSIMEEMYDRNSKLEAVLKGIVNGVIAIDDHGKIILINEAAKKILNLSNTDVIDKYLLEVIRNYKLSRELDSYIHKKTKNNVDFEINLPQNKTLKVYINPIVNSELANKTIGTVIVFNDITELKRLERIRSDFVANVSHELRTPLTSIMGFVETLKEGNIKDEATTERFLDIISLETERLTRLINDILTLSEIENVREDVKKDVIGIKDLIEDITYILDSKAKEKNVNILIKIDPEDLKIIANRDRIHQLFINLIDNGIKYNKENGTVIINVWKEKCNINISVKDTGIGIPREHIPRIFERFYRVDKGRSRKLGGTGLGLAIVKHIIESMNGDIVINSEPGVGTEFLITLNGVCDNLT